MFKLRKALESFKIKAEVQKKELGAVLDCYYIKMARGEKINKLRLALESIALEIGVESIRLVTKGGYVILEIPSNSRKVIRYSDIFQGVDKNQLQLVAGEKVDGKPFYIDLKKAPHLLVAGATGTGKSVFLNSAITGLIETYDSQKVKLALIDPKRVEFSPYNNIKHLFCDIAKDIESAENVLLNLVDEMENRYIQLESSMVRNIDELREKGVDLPYIICIVDEFADLVLNNKNIENLIQCLAQKSRACGIHLIIATQRPSVDVVTGKIKANFPSRLSFQTVTKYDSKTILDESGAEILLGKGDALIMQAGEKIQRIHCCYIDNEKIDDVANENRAETKLFNDKDYKRESIDIEQKAMNWGFIIVIAGLIGVLLSESAKGFFIVYAICLLIFFFYNLILSIKSNK